MTSKTALKFFFTFLFGALLVGLLTAALATGDDPRGLDFIHSPAQAPIRLLCELTEQHDGSLALDCGEITATVPAQH